MRAAWQDIVSGAVCVAAMAVVLAGVIILAGWGLGSELLMRLGADHPLSPSAGLFFALWGMAVIADAMDEVRASLILASAALVLAGSVLLTCVLGAPAWIDSLLIGWFAGGIADGGSRMSGDAALAGVLLAIGILLLPRPEPAGLVAACCAAVGGAMGLGSFVILILNLPVLPILVDGMKVQSALLLATSGSVLLLWTWNRGFRANLAAAERSASTAAACGPTWLPLPLGLGAAVFSLFTWVVLNRSELFKLSPIGGGLLLLFGLATIPMLMGLAWLAQRSRIEEQRAQALASALEVEIHDRRRAQQQLAEMHQALVRANSRLAGIIEGTQEMVSAVDSDLRLILMNHAFINETHRILGVWPRFDQPVTELLPDQDEDRITFEQDWRRALNGESFVAVHEMGNPSRLRNIYEMSFSPLRDENGNIQGAFNIVRDISEREHTERRIRAERDLSQAVIDSLPGVFYLIGESGHLLRWNRNLERVTGCSSEEAASMGLLDFFAPECRERVMRMAETVQISGWAEAEAELQSRSGMRTPYLFTSRAISIGDQPCIIGTGVDVTALKQVEAELADKTRALQSSNAELEQFAYVASHDLREPLRMIGSYVGLLERRYGDRLDDDAREFIAFARDGATRMDKLILDLLEYSRVGRRGAPFSEASLGDIIEIALANLHMAIHDCAAAVTVEGTFPSLICDQNEIMRLFQNLIGNALKYRAEDRKPQIHVWCESEGTFWRFFIRDNGIGIASEHFDRIFQIFQRLQPRGSVEGTGIGLALCKKIVERHGGQIGLTSEPGAGSTFTFTLPKGKSGG